MKAFQLITKLSFDKFTYLPKEPIDSLKL